MKVTLNNTFQVDEPIEKVWALLSDPYEVAPCLPGAELHEQVADNQYRGAVRMKLGPLSAQFKGDIFIEALDRESHEIRLVGKGRDARGTGNASMNLSGRLNALSDGGTEVVTDAELNVGGKLAQFGSRMLEDVGKSMFNQFVRNFTQRVKGDASGQERHGGSVSLSQVAGTAIRGVVGRWLGKDEPEGDKEA